MQALPLINPASAGMDGDFEVNLGNQRHLGLWSNNYTYYINGNYRIYNRGKNRDNFHSIGASTIGEQEGKFLSRTRVYGLYAYHLKLSEKITVSAGATVGFMNYLVSGNDYSAGGSSTAPDANIGVWMYGNNYYLGVSSNQIFEGKLTPIRESTVLLRYWNITASKTFVLSEHLSLRSALLTRLMAGYDPNIDLSLAGVINGLIMAGVNYQHQRDIAIFFGIERLKLGNSLATAVLSYNIPISSYKVPNIQTFEITLKYILLNKLIVKPKEEKEELNEESE